MQPADKYQHYYAVNSFRSMPEWGNLDILKACGASDPGSNPGSGVGVFQVFALRNRSEILPFLGSTNGNIKA
jgi:hypothetical protein